MISGVVVDADGHIMEPGTMWLDYIDPSYRENVIRVQRDAVDGDKLILNGVASRKVRRLGGQTPHADGSTVNWNFLDGLPTYTPYHQSCNSASFDPEARLQWMDQQGITISVLFPSLGLIWPSEIKASGDYIAAHMSAYNRWIMDFSSHDRKRLVPVAQTTIFDLAHAIADLRQVSRMGFHHIMLPFVTQEAESCFSRQYDRFWGEVEDLGLSVHLHKAAIPHQLNIPSRGPFAQAGNGRLFAHVNEILPAQLCLASLMDNGIPDRYPKIKFTFLECNAGWLPSWLDRADESFGVLHSHNICPLKEPPRQYIENTDNFFFGLGMNERLSPLAPYWRKLLLATDFPHPDAPLDSITAWRSYLSELDAEDSATVIGLNALRLLNIEVAEGVSA